MSKASEIPALAQTMANGVRVDGEILHRVRLDAHGLVGGLSVEERGRGGDIDLLVDCADLQGNAQLGGFIGAQRDTLLDEFLESGGFHGEFVGTGKQLGESVAARAACYCSPLLIGCGIGELHPDSRDDSSARIRKHAGEAGSEGLAEAGPVTQGCEQRKRDDRNQKNGRGFN